jgi:hypothetical protein
MDFEPCAFVGLRGASELTFVGADAPRAQVRRKRQPSQRALEKKRRHRFILTNF